MSTFLIIFADKNLESGRDNGTCFISYADIEALQVSLCSKRKKHLEAVQRYWKQQAEIYSQCLDEGADTDSQDSVDRGVHSSDTYKKST